MRVTSIKDLALKCFYQIKINSQSPKFLYLNPSEQRADFPPKIFVCISVDYKNKDIRFLNGCGKIFRMTFSEISTTFKDEALYYWFTSRKPKDLSLG